MKFRLAALFPSDDPFGGGPVTVDVVDRSGGSFRFATESFLPATPMPANDNRPFFGDATSLSSRSSSSGRFKFTPETATKTDSMFDAFGPATQEFGTFSKSSADSFSKFCQFTKLQEQPDGNVLVWGIATWEKPDLDNEICEYETAKQAYQQWSVAAVTRTSGAGQQVSLGNIRYQHSIEPAGKATKIDYNDDAREVWLGSIPISDDIRNELQQGFLTGYSQGGSYAWRKCADCGKSLTLQQANNFCPNCKKNVQVLFGLKRLSEVSYVDSPCTGVGFVYVKGDGTSQTVGFRKRANSADTNAARVVDKACIFQGRGDFQIWKSTVEVDGRKRTVVHWPGGTLVA